MLNAISDVIFEARLGRGRLGTTFYGLLLGFESCIDIVNINLHTQGPTTTAEVKLKVTMRK